MTGVELGVVIAVVLTAAILTPYLVKEIWRGKAQLGSTNPVGTGDTHPGSRGNPAPGQFDAQADPYDEQARR